MKIDKRKPLHWLYLLGSSLVAFIVLCLRPIAKVEKKVILLYGHKLNGNLLSIYLKKNEIKTHGLNVYYATIDYEYYRKLKQKNESVLFLSSPHSITLLLKTTAIISDHGLHSLSLLLRRTDIKFFDVWHGIPFKGFNQSDFLTQHKYDEIWVSSEYIKNLYVNKFGFNPQQIQVTGYGRTDRLVISSREANKLESMNIRDQFELPPDSRKVILFAPTWKQDSKSRSELPFEIKKNEFLSNIRKICKERDSIFIIRSHLNSQTKDFKNEDPIYVRSHSDYPDSEGLLTLVDVLICDWSSIAFDFLLLNKPTIFLDVPAPFKKGFSLDPEHRFGKVLNNPEDLYKFVSKYIDNHETYKYEFIEKHEKIKQKVYGNTLDGNSTNRYVGRLIAIINSKATAETNNT